MTTASSSTPRRIATSVPLLAVLVLAAALRLWAIDFGLDVPRVRPDEEFVVGKARLMLETGDPNPHFFHYPSLLLYLDAALLRAASVSGDLLEPRLVGRLLTAAVGVGTVFLVVVLGERLASRTAGLLAGLFLAVAYQHVRESHFATTDVPLVFFVVASLAAGVEGRHRRRVGLLRVAMLLAGLAASTKYTGVVALAPLSFLVVTFPGLSPREKIREVVLGAAVWLSAFALTSPFVLLDPEGARASLSELFRETWGEGRLSSWDPLYPVTFSLRYGLGVPLLTLGILGAAASLRAPRAWRGGLLVLWIASFYAAAALTPTRFARYALPIVPPLALGAAVAVESLPVRKLVKGLVVVGAAAPTFLAAVQFDRVLAREDTRSLARSWIESHLPSGTRLLVSEGYGAPALPEGYPFRSVGSRAGAVREGEREGFAHLVTHEHPALSRFSRIDESLKKRLETAVLLARFDPFRPGASPGRFDELDAFYVPYERPGSIERPGPIVSIWRLE